MSAVKGKKKEQVEFSKKLFVGFTSVKVAAINPTRSELNKLLNREEKETDKEFDYGGTDQDGNPRVRLAFWLHDEKTNEYFVHSFNLVKKDRKNKDGNKLQVINSTCNTTWVPYLEDGTEADLSVLPDWFVKFLSKEVNGEREVLGTKKVRKALSGEEELATILRAWLGKLDYNDPDTEVSMDTDQLVDGKVKELRDLIGCEYETSFVILLGVKTDEDDANKKYQHVWGKSFLPNGFMKYINNGNKFPSDYAKKVWNKFTEEVLGDYGFDGYTELVPLTEYDPSKDLSGSDKTKKETPAASSEY